MSTTGQDKIRRDCETDVVKHTKAFTYRGVMMRGEQDRIKKTLYNPLFSFNSWAVPCKVFFVLRVQI